jgi:two-component SAPR family response regulator
MTGLNGKAGLAGLRVLVVEDEMLIALLIEDVLTDMGCVVVGPVSSLDEALRLARDEATPISIAILDVTIRGGLVFPVVDALIARAVPFALASGYGAWTLPEHLRSQPRLSKPFSRPDLEAQVRALAARI